MINKWGKKENFYIVIFMFFYNAGNGTIQKDKEQIDSLCSTCGAGVVSTVENICSNHVFYLMPQFEWLIGLLKCYIWGIMPMETLCILSNDGNADTDAVTYRMRKGKFPNKWLNCNPQHLWEFCLIEIFFPNALCS